MSEVTDDLPIIEPEEERVRCRFCERLNKVKTPSTTTSASIRCGRCRLPLSSDPHKKWTNLDPHSYIHPLDSQALSALQKLPGIDTILKKALEIFHESSARVMFTANSVRVNERQCPDLDAKLDVVCSTLGIEKPELYIAVTGPGGGLGFNAFTGGVEKPFIVIYSSLLERLDDMEVLAVLAHEAGHIHSQHLLYKVAADLLFFLSDVILRGSPFAAIADLLSLPIRIALLTWRHKAELSCDRAALLVTQNERVVASTMMKLAGGTLASRLDLDEFIAQARDFDKRAAEDFLHKFWTTIIAGTMSHPFPVWRVSEIIEWAEKEEGYRRLINK
ncbi:MAG: M48 family metallopeptidase [Blastocatellia bacterium]|nr:M48 family metallopeptidase [Blastocatellia bacterium]MBL8196888.1 M48 family metallopeptidase [Blastocatellia bacterium]MBN8723907.1 M48 family metallopeptidase [Acidobacteriota bacterium]